jgi:glycosyltransferase involved in cell wall biosynthesis
MRRVAVLSSFYPSGSAPYAHMFAHTRSRYYKSHGYDVEVFVPSKFADTYKIYGIVVHRLPVREILRRLEGFDAATIHLLYHRADKDIDAGPVYDVLARSGIPLLFFIHGVEVQSIWRSRRADIAFRSPRSIARWLYRDIFLLRRMKSTVQAFLSQDRAMTFVAPSRWMFEEAHKTLGIDLMEHGVVIPNGIDTKRFTFGDRWEHRHRLLSLRPLEWGGKYGVDLALKAAAELPSPFEFEPIGKGRDENVVREWLDQNDGRRSIRLNTKFLPHAQIA